MTITANDRRTEALGDGTVGPFSFDFKVLDEEHIEAYVDGTVQTLSTHYTVAGVGADGGGTITFVVGSEPASGVSVLMVGSVPNAQEYAYTEGDDFPASAHEDALDAIVQMIQQFGETFGRCLKFPVTSLYEGAEMPDPEDGYILQWSSGNLINVALGSSSLVAFSPWGVAFVANTNGASGLEDLGFSDFMITMVDDNSATVVLETLGFSTFMSGMVDDENAASVLATLALLTSEHEYTKTQNYDISTVASASNVTTLSAKDNPFAYILLDENTTITAVSDLAEGRSIMLELQENATGAHTLAWDSSIDFAGQDPEHNNAASAVTAYLLWCGKDEAVRAAKLWEDD